MSSPNGNGQTRAVEPLMEKFGAVVGLDPVRAQSVLMSTLMPKGASKEAVAIFLAICAQHDLNPLLGHLSAFQQGGAVKPILQIDGWMALANRQAQFDGIEHEDVREDGKLVAITAKVYRKDRTHPSCATEYMEECYQERSPVWKKWPARMLRHKATIQALRLAFSFSGLLDEDEAERIREAEAARAKQEKIDASPIRRAAQDMSKGRKAKAEEPSEPEPEDAEFEPSEPDPQVNDELDEQAGSAFASMFGDDGGSMGDPEA